MRVHRSWFRIPWIALKKLRSLFTETFYKDDMDQFFWVKKYNKLQCGDNFVDAERKGNVFCFVLFWFDMSEHSLSERLWERTSVTVKKWQLKNWQWTYLRPSHDCGSLFPDRKPSIILVSRFLWWRRTVQDTLPATRPNESQRHVPDINNFEMRLFSEQRNIAYLNMFVERKIIGSSFLLFIIPDEEQRNRKIKLLSLIPMPRIPLRFTV